MDLEVWVCVREFGSKCIKTVNTIIVSIKMNTQRYGLKGKKTLQTGSKSGYFYANEYNERIYRWCHMKPFARRIVRYESFDNWNLELYMWRSLHACVCVWLLLSFFQMEMEKYEHKYTWDRTDQQSRMNIWNYESKSKKCMINKFSIRIIHQIERSILVT